MTDDRFSRRSALRLGAAGLAAASLPMTARAQDRPVATGHPFPDGVALPERAPAAATRGGIGVAVVGLGYYALAKMMPAFAETDQVHIAALVSGNQDKLARVGNAYGLREDQLYTYDTFDRIAADRRVDAVYIVLPSGLHADWTVRSFAAGKHVLCEKPMALSSSECERMIAAAEAAGRRLMIEYRCHFEPYNLKAMELMAEGEIGAVRTLRANQQRVMPMQTPEQNWRLDRQLAGGGPLEDYGIYGVQAALYLTGEMPVSVSASTIKPEGDPRFREIFAAVNSQLNFPSGASAQLATSYDAHALNKVDIWGSEGAVLFEPATSYSGQDLIVEKNGRRRRLDPGDPARQFANILDHFGRAVREGSPFETPAEMGLRDVRLMEAIYAAADRGRTIGLDPDGRMLKG